MLIEENLVRWFSLYRGFTLLCFYADFTLL